MQQGLPQSSAQPQPRVLHVCSDFAKQKLYPQLVQHLDALGLTQLVYVPVRTAAEIDVNRDDTLAQTSFHYSHILRPRHRILFRTKIRTVVRDLLRVADPAALTLVHSHFLYSDGAVALALHRRFGLPYVVSVRNTDVNVFMRARPDLRWVCRDVIAHASAVVFVTPAYRQVLRDYLPAAARAQFDAKAHIVPNGISGFWLDGAVPLRPAGDTLRLLYVGDFSRNKNIATTLRATALLNGVRRATLTLVGAGGDGEEQIAAMLASGSFSFVSRLGRVDDARALRDIYRAHDIFVMPSLRETFGVAYVEALSQGLPVVFTRGQGIDGYFRSGTVGEAVDPRDANEIRAAIEALAGRLAAIRAECVQQARSFAWPKVAGTYFDLYGTVSQS